MLAVFFSHILIVSSWRSGSSMVADLLNHYPGAFYSFEPIQYLAEGRNDYERYPEAPAFLGDTFKCKFDDPTFFKHMSIPVHNFLYKHNYRMAKARTANWTPFSWPS